MLALDRLWAAFVPLPLSWARWTLISEHPIFIYGSGKNPDPGRGLNMNKDSTGQQRDESVQRYNAQASHSSVVCPVSALFQLVSSPWDPLRPSESLSDEFCVSQNESSPKIACARLPPS